MTNKLLGVIAVCLIMITANLFIPKAEALIDGKTGVRLARDRDFTYAVLNIVERYCVVGDEVLIDQKQIDCHPNQFD